MSEPNDIEIRIDRDVIRIALEEAIIKKRQGSRLNSDDVRLIARAMKLLEPLFVNAEQGVYALYPKSRLKKAAIVKAIIPVANARTCYVDFVSCSAPISRENWMSDDAFEYTTELGFAQVVRRSVDPWLETVLKKKYSSVFAHGHADWNAAEDLFRQAFGNRLHVAINQTLFSGAAYPVESAVIHFIAFALTGSDSRIESLIPLMRLLPRAIPLGKRPDREDTWNVLTK
ncbi:MAG: hypothetical protein U9Q03_05845 [Patescibacteria group bacterium]|nr:hypothetical protein [Patescibacteria group bacterium]